MFVGIRPNLDLVFSVSAVLLCYFSPTIRQQLLAEGDKVVVLEYSDKKATSWALKWMIAGGAATKTVVTIVSDLPSMDDLLRRLQVIFHLKIGRLQVQMIGDLQKLLAVTPFQTESVRWLYNHTNDNISLSLRQILAAGLVKAILDGHTIHSSWKLTAAELPALHSDLLKVVASKATHDQIHHLQLYKPLTTYQLGFLYAFSDVGSSLRKTVAKDLLNLIDAGKVPNIEAYHNYAWQNGTFETDMVAAMDAKQSRLEQKAKAKVEAKSNCTVPMRKGYGAARKELHRSNGNSQKYKVIVKADETDITITHGKGNGNVAGGKHGAAKATTANRYQTLARATNSKPPLTCQLKVEAMLSAAISRPAPRVQSYTVLRLTMDGQVEREK